jgi:hypothetical protein
VAARRATSPTSPHAVIMATVILFSAHLGSLLMRYGTQVLKMPDMHSIGAEISPTPTATQETG